jgi:hypothetical protein
MPRDSFIVARRLIIASPQRSRRIPQMLRVMVTIDLLHHVDRHPDQTRRLPWIDTGLQYPGHCGVPQHMRRHSGERGPRRRVPERVSGPSDRAAANSITYSVVDAACAAARAAYSMSLVDTTKRFRVTIVTGTWNSARRLVSPARSQIDSMVAPEGTRDKLLRSIC